MISLSDQKSVALEVTVTNTNGDDAYEASVIANFPRSVTYSTYLSPSGVSFFYPIISLPHICYLFLNGKVLLIAASFLQRKYKWIYG